MYYLGHITQKNLLKLLYMKRYINTIKNTTFKLIINKYSKKKKKIIYINTYYGKIAFQKRAYYICINR